MDQPEQHLCSSARTLQEAIPGVLQHHAEASSLQAIRKSLHSGPRIRRQVCRRHTFHILFPRI